MTALVSRIDHVYAVLEEAEEAHRFLHEDVGLPVAWPFESYGTFASGGIALGNLNLEFLPSGPGWPARTPARITGIAFAPSRAADEQFLAELDERGVEHSPLWPTPGWTNVGIEGIGGADVRPFVCDYHFPQTKDQVFRREQLEAARGGKIRLVAARELVVGTPEPLTTAERWQRLLGPAEPDGELRWILGWGPSFRLVEHDREEVIDLVLDVASPEAARVWAELGAEDRLSGVPVSFRPPA